MVTRMHSHASFCPASRPFVGDEQLQAALTAFGPRHQLQWSYRESVARADFDLSSADIAIQAQLFSLEHAGEVPLAKNTRVAQQLRRRPINGLPSMSMIPHHLEVKYAQLRSQCQVVDASLDFGLLEML